MLYYDSSIAYVVTYYYRQDFPSNLYTVEP